MPIIKPFRRPRLTPYSTYAERGIALEECPNCHNDRISKTPRRNGGPSGFRCRKCGYVANINDVTGMHWMLGHRAA